MIFADSMADLIPVRVHQCVTLIVFHFAYELLWLPTILHPCSLKSFHSNLEYKIDPLMPSAVAVLYEAGHVSIEVLTLVVFPVLFLYKLYAFGAINWNIGLSTSAPCSVENP